ncbi:hypothetical protein [Neogemmobacter tilapiae]|uniref:Uncharacterized protein n=1 Tax=Neogemmobacter tilapiae TaxID=875041 RepID=A0A918TDI6_9RHOB|nr:hypothetical protein [Gemmobacter tilapiae]GHC43599.1 hypothetical protein GCM10007315_00790 [Gemmobacter tilapiae]
MSLIEDLGERLARDVLASREELGDDYFHEKVSKVLGAASPTMQEAFMTAIKMYLAEERGRLFLYETLAAVRGVTAKEVAATMGPRNDAPVVMMAAPAVAAAAPAAKPAPEAKPKSNVSAAAKARMISEAMAAFGDDPVPPKPNPHLGT